MAIDLNKYRLNQETPLSPISTTIPASGNASEDAAVGLGTSILEAGKGALKGLASTAQGFSDIGQNILGATVGKGIEALGGQKPSKVELPKEWTTPSNFAQEIGFKAEQIGEYLIPVAAEEKAAVLLSKFLPNIAKNPKLIGKLTNLAARSLGSGLEFSGKTVLQTGGDLEQAKVSGIIGAIVPGAVGTLGAIKKVITERLPERLYDQIFKQSTDDLMQYYRTLSKGGEINPTLAREVMERGLKGSSENMAIYSIRKLDELEEGVQETVQLLKSQGVKITMENKQGYVDILGTIKDQFKSGFLSNRAKDAESMAKELNKIKGSKIGIDLALKVRRFIDKMRNTSSFRMDPKLTPRQEEFKVAADTLRKSLSDAGLGDLMKEESVYISALEDIVKDAAARKNVKLLNLTDVIIGGGGMATGFPGAGLGAAAAIRGFQQPFTLTSLGQALFKSGKAIESVLPFIEGLPKIIPPMITQK